MGKEREFLHDISSPLTTIQLNLESVVALLAERNPKNEADCTQLLQSCLNQLKKASELIRARRTVLVAAEENK